jgi:outer membrane murein-binding lipoprotein Lpp
VRVFSVVIVGLALAGCVSSTSKPPTTQQTTQTVSYDPQLTAYINCNRAAVRAVAMQSGDPVSLAYAARGTCVREDLALAVAVQDWAISSNVEEYTMRLAREKMLENNAASIVAIRTRASQAPQQSTTSLPAPSSPAGKYY